LNTVTRLAFVHQVVIENNVRTPRQLTWWRTFRHFLDADPLMILEVAKSEFCLECMTIVIGCRK
jgi:hypothetical protein